MSRVRTVTVGARVLARLALWTTGGLAAGLVLAIAAPLVVGHRPLTVLSGSMEPELRTGDVIVVKQIAPAEARVGNVVTFRDSEGRLITHRVRRVRANRGRVEFVTKGDANNASERWTISAAGYLGRTVYRMPRAGHALAFARTRPGKLLLVVLPLVALAALELTAISSSHTEVRHEARA